MKKKISITQHIVITEPDRFLRGHHESCFTMFESDSSHIVGWIDLGEFTFEAEIDLEAMTKEACEDIDRKIEKERENFKAKIEALERTKAEMASLPAPEEADGS